MKLWLILTVILLINASVADFSEILTEEELQNVIGNIPPEDNTSANNNPVSLSPWKGKLCARICNRSRPRICYFKWVLEYYHVLGP